MGNFKKYRSFIFLLSIIIIFLIVGKIMLRNKNSGKEINLILEKSDSYINGKKTPQFNKAFDLLDSCLTEDRSYYDNTKFKEKYDRLKIIINIQ
jgi:hypothetical protein